MERCVLAAAPGRFYQAPSATPERYAAIVLGANVIGDRPSDVLEDRLQAALELYEAGRVRRILVSGAHRSDGCDEPNAMRRWLVRRGVPDRDIFLDHAGFRTLDTMVRAARVFQVQEAVVVTQAFHMPRALFLADAAGLNAVGLIADRRTYAWAAHYERRELLARVLSWLDVRVFHRQPRFLGPLLPITGSAAATHDAQTERGDPASAN
jgi:SanA protein